MRRGGEKFGGVSLSVITGERKVSTKVEYSRLSKVRCSTDEIRFILFSEKQQTVD